MADIVILGGGPAGYSCALRAAQLDKSVILVEQHKVGGTCLHRGCIPTKALLHAGELVDAIRRGSTIGIDVTIGTIDSDAVHHFKDGVVSRLYHGLQGLISSHKNIEVVNASGTYAGGTTVVVDDDFITGQSLVLATGSRPRVPSGLRMGSRIVTSDDALTLREVPRRAIVCGGGVIGVEFASMWRSLGTDVTVIEALPRLLASEDEWASDELRRAFRRRDITVLTDTRVAQVEEYAESVAITVDGGETITADVALIAVGRYPNTQGLGLAENGVDIDESGHVVVHDDYQTTAEDVYAIGDVIDGPQLAHRGFQQGVHVAETIAGLSSPTPADSNIPRIAYCSPEVASVGLTEAQARERYGEVRTITVDLSGNGKSQILGVGGGVKLVRLGANDGPVVGVHMVGERVSELIGEAQLIVNWGAHPNEVAQLIHAHPTQNEALGEAHLALAGRPLHGHQ